MSLSPAAGVEEGWPERVLACGVSVRPSLSDEHFIVWFRTAINVTRRPQSFHVSLPQCDSNYIVVCRGRVVAFVKAMSSSSVEVTETASLEARRTARTLAKLLTNPLFPLSSLQWGPPRN